MRKSMSIALVLISLALSAPGTLFFVSQTVLEPSANAIHRGSAKGEKNVWLTTPAFSILDSKGSNRVFVAALKMENAGDASRVCQWMPIVRDRIQSLVMDVKQEAGIQGAAGEIPALYLEKRRLKLELAAVLETGTPMNVAFVDIMQDPDAVLSGGEPVECKGRYLTRRKQSLFIS